jgi:hypothetical protein
MIAGNDNLRPGKRVEKHAGGLEFRSTRALRQIPGNSDEVRRDLVDQFDQRAINRFVNAAKVQIGKMNQGANRCAS